MNSNAEVQPAFSTPGAPRLANRRAIWVALALVAFVSLPFLNKPFTIDDPVVLTVTEQVLRDPLRPFDTTINWFGDPAPLFTVTTNPPFVSYWLAPFLAVFGYSEIALHASFIPFLILLALSMVSLSNRFTSGSLIPLLLVMTSPAIVVSPNLMRDVPAAALLTGAIALFVAGCDSDSRWKLFWGAFLAGLAFLSKYPHIVAVLILGFYAILHRRYVAMRWLLVTLAMAAGWFVQNWLFQGTSHLGYLARERGLDNGITPASKFYSAVVIVGSCLLIAPAAIVQSHGRRARLAALALLTLAGVALGRKYLLFHNNSFTLQIALWTAAGTLTLAWLLLESFTEQNQASGGKAAGPSRDTVFLLVWAILPIFISIFFIFFQAVRHIIPAIPPLSLLAVHLFARSGRLNWAPARWTFGVIIAAQAVMSILVGIADYDFADTHRKMAATVQERYADAGENVWFRGSWGWQTYALNNGYSMMATHGEPPPPGSVAVWPDNIDRGRLPEGLEPRLERIETLEHRQRLPIHTMTGGASFYAVTRGMLPYWFGGRQTWTAGVYRVKAPETEPAESQGSE